ncbi:MAG: RHS repeat domain-containing protein, partial [Planctomycetota bacterium]
MTKSYIYSNNRSQILCQRAGGQSADEYFYVTDRLGSVRQLVDKDKNIVLNYTFNPFGATLEKSKKTGYEYSFNSFMFTGQWLDSQFGQYYLRARMYDPALGRFTTRDPVFGKLLYPLTLHPYLYCQNDPVN